MLHCWRSEEFHCHFYTVGLNLLKHAVMMKAYLLPQVDAAERSHVARFVFPEHFAHGAGGRLTGEAVDVDPLLFVILTQELLPYRGSMPPDARAGC